VSIQSPATLLVGPQQPHSASHRAPTAAKVRAAIRQIDLARKTRHPAKNKSPMYGRDSVQVPARTMWDGTVTRRPATSDMDTIHGLYRRPDIMLNHHYFAAFRQRERLRSIVISTSVCLCVCLSARISREPHARSLSNSYTCCLWPWLGPPPTG